MKRKIILIVFLCAALALQASAQTEAQPQLAPPVLKGRVTDADTKAPIKAARVIAGQMGATTGENGAYVLRLDQLRFGGVFSVKVVADGYEENWIRDVIANAGQTTILNISLAKKQFKQRRTFSIKYRKPTELARAVSTILQGTQGISASNDLMTITLTDFPPALAEADSLIRILDVPLKKIWLEVLFIRAVNDDARASFISQEIGNVAKQLRALFKFRQYYLAGKAVAMGVENEELQIETSSKDTTMSSFLVSTVPRYTSGTIKLEDMRLQFWWKPRPFMKSPDTDLRTTINLKDGETVILGASQGDESQGAMISVVTARVVR